MKNNKNIVSVVKNFTFDEVKLPLEAVITTAQVRLLDLEEVLDATTGEIKAIKLYCGVGQMKTGMYLRTFNVKIPTSLNKLTEDEVALQPHIELENAYLVPYAFINQRGAISKGATVVADDFTVIPDEEVEVIL